LISKKEKFEFSSFIQSDTKGSTSKSRTPTRFDRKTPTTSVADESEFTPEKYKKDFNRSKEFIFFSTCIFCGEKNEDFVRDGLEQHYWANCPMLRRCQECNQVRHWIVFLLFKH
jgi:hypothetical protein